MQFAHTVGWITVTVIVNRVLKVTYMHTSNALRVGHVGHIPLKAISTQEKGGTNENERKRFFNHRRGNNRL